MRRLLLLVVLCACGRDLAVPPQALPPVIDAVTPAAAYAGDVVEIAGSNLNDPAIQVFFDLRVATIVTPPAQRDGKKLVVEVPEDVLGTAVSITSTQGTATWSQPFKYLGLGHPRTLALRANLSLAADVANAVPIAGGYTALLDWRYGTLIPVDSGANPETPIRIGGHPVLAFGPRDSFWVLDATEGVPPFLRRVDLTVAFPSAGLPVPVSGSVAGADGSPSGTRFAIPDGTSVNLYGLPGGLRITVPIPGATSDVAAVRFAGDTTIIGLTQTEPFRIELGPSPSVQVGATFPVTVHPSAAFPVVAIDAAAKRLAFESATRIRLLSWDTGAPVLESQELISKVNPQMMTFTSSAATLLVGEVITGIVAAIEISSGALLATTQVPGAISLATIPDGDDQGFVVAATGSGTALLFPDGRILRTRTLPVNMRSTAVDPVCGDVLVASGFGPLQVTHDTLTPFPISISLQLDGVEASGAGVVGWEGDTIYAYVPPANCRGVGSFVKVATAENVPIEAALSDDGRWVATSDGQILELIPRTDTGQGFSKQTLDFGTLAVSPIRYSNNSLTVGHPTKDGYAISTYAQGTLREVASLPLPNVASGLKRVRFAAAWVVDEKQFDSQNNFISTKTTVWDEARGVLATGNVPAFFTVPAAVSADGHMMVGVSTIAHQAGLDTLIVEVASGRLLQILGPHVELPGSPQQVFPSPDGGRLYAALPEQNSIAIVE